jgi:uncharacterized membrane protein YeaQ/YmgE (transglycosylase-associated protein family)
MWLVGLFAGVGGTFALFALSGSKDTPTIAAVLVGYVGASLLQAVAASFRVTASRGGSLLGRGPAVAVAANRSGRQGPSGDIQPGWRERAIKAFK